MGGDHGSRPCVMAALAFAADFPDTSLVLFGDSSELNSALAAQDCPANVSVRASSSVISFDDEVSHALRRKRDSSMALALKAVAEGEADACVSSGNTGALLALGRHFIKTLDNIDRPAICRAIPTQKGESFMLDLGANLNCSAKSLYQFGLMGAALACVRGVNEPSIAILNVGSEMSKGGATLRQAAHKLQCGEQASGSSYRFGGFVEGDKLFSGQFDVVVCDGFSGNVALKVSEGLVAHMVQSLNAYFDETRFGFLLKVFVRPILDRWSRKKNPSLYNGAAFLGLRKTVIKSHGSADELGFYKALEAARQQVRESVPNKIKSYICASSAELFS